MRGLEQNEDCGRNNDSRPPNYYYSLHFRVLRPPTQATFTAHVFHSRSLELGNRSGHVFCPEANVKCHPSDRQERQASDLLVKLGALKFSCRNLIMPCSYIARTDTEVKAGRARATPAPRLWN